MDRTKVTSSQIASVGYDPEKRVLEIEFVKGGVYRYPGVKFTIHKGLMEAESKGRYFSQNIKGVYQFEKQ